MTIIRSHKIQLKPNSSHVEYFRRACGCARQAYNWALARTKEMLDAGEVPDDGLLKKEFNSIKRAQFPWQLVVTKCAAEGALANFSNAKRRFLKKLSNFPVFHKKGEHDSFYLDNESFKLNGKRVLIPKLGWVKMSEDLRFHGKIMSAVVSCTANRWFISIAVAFEPQETPIRENQTVGVDLGIKHFAVLSTGEKYEGPKALKQKMGRLRMLSKAVSRTKIGSNRRRKAALRLAKLHWRIANIRKDFLHKLTSPLVWSFTHIVIENLDVKDMLSNHRFARHIADQSFFEFRRQLEYKSQTASSVVLIADRFYPSSKTCSCCGYVKDSLTLSERVFRCEKCGLELDRDLNAALNLKNLAAGLAVSARGVGCGKCQR